MVRRADPEAVAAVLIAYGKSLKETGEKQGIVVDFTPDDAANNMLMSDPNAFLIGVIFDQDIVAERAWAAPWHLSQRLGHFDMARIASMPIETLREAIAGPPALHRYVEKMPKWVHRAAQRVLGVYGGSAHNIWNDNPTMEDLMNRLRCFDGIGQKKASMAANLLRRELNVPMRLSASSQVSYDIHIRRVFLRSGLAGEDNEGSIQEAARSFSPFDPGLLDLPAWWIGRNWCRPQIPLCGDCPVSKVCAKDLTAFVG